MNLQREKRSVIRADYLKISVCHGASLRSNKISTVERQQKWWRHSIQDASSRKQKARARRA
jgi:hypothetical protein